MKYLYILVLFLVLCILVYNSRRIQEPLSDDYIPVPIILLDASNYDEKMFIPNIPIPEGRPTYYAHGGGKNGNLPYLEFPQEKSNIYKYYKGFWYASEVQGYMSKGLTFVWYAKYSPPSEVTDTTIFSCNLNDGYLLINISKQFLDLYWYLGHGIDIISANHEIKDWEPEVWNIYALRLKPIGTNKFELSLWINGMLKYTFDKDGTFINGIMSNIYIGSFNYTNYFAVFDKPLNETVMNTLNKKFLSLT